MKYLQNGSFQKHPLMRLTLSLTAILLAGFVVSNFLLYFSKMDFTPASVISYYLGSEETFQVPRTYQSMLEVTHMHLPMMALVILMLTHLLIFAPISKGGKIAFIIVAFLSGLLNEGSGWLVRFVDSDFAWLKILSFLTLQGSLIFLLIMLIVYLWRPQTQQEDAELGPQALNSTLKKSSSPLGHTKPSVTLHAPHK